MDGSPEQLTPLVHYNVSNDTVSTTYTSGPSTSTSASPSSPANLLHFSPPCIPLPKKPIAASCAAAACSDSGFAAEGIYTEVPLQDDFEMQELYVSVAESTAC